MQASCVCEKSQQVCVIKQNAGEGGAWDKLQVHDELVHITAVLLQ